MALERITRESRRSYKGKVAVDAFIPKQIVDIELRDSNKNIFSDCMSFQYINKKNPLRFALFNEELAFFTKRIDLNHVRVFPFKILHQGNTSYVDFNDNKTYLPFRNICLYREPRHAGQLMDLYKMRLEETK